MAPRTRKEIDTILKEDLVFDAGELKTGYNAMFLQEYYLKLEDQFPKVDLDSRSDDETAYSIVDIEVPCIKGTSIKPRLVGNRKRYKEFKKQYKEAVRSLKKDIDNSFEELKEGGAYTNEEIEYAKDYVKCLSTSKHDRALRGYSGKYMLKHFMISGGMDSLFQCGNNKINDLMMDGLRMEKHGLPLSGATIGLDKILNTMTDYLYEKDNDKLSPAESIRLRDQMLNQIEETLPLVEKLAKSNPFGKETQVMDNYFGKAIGGDEAELLNERYERGTSLLLYGMTGMQAGLRNGWPIEDLNMLASFTYVVKTEHLTALIDRKEHNLDPRNKSRYTPGQKEFLSECDKLIKTIQNTPIKSEAQRNDLIEKISELTATAKKNRFLNVCCCDTLMEEVDRAREHKLSKTPTVFCSSPDDALKRFNTSRAGIFRNETAEHENLRKEAENLCRLKKALNGDERSNFDNKSQEELKQEIRESAECVKKLADVYIGKKDKNPGTPAGVARLYGAAELKLVADQFVKDLDSKPTYPDVDLDPKPYNRDEVIPEDIQKEIDERAKKRESLEPLRKEHRDKRKIIFDQAEKAAEEKEARERAEEEKRREEAAKKKGINAQAKKKTPAEEYIDKHSYRAKYNLRLPNIDVSYMATTMKLSSVAKLVTCEYYSNHKDVLDTNGQPVMPEAFEKKLLNEEAFKNVVVNYSGAQLLEMAESKSLILNVLKEENKINPLQAENEQPEKEKVKPSGTNKETNNNDGKNIESKQKATVSKGMV